MSLVAEPGDAPDVAPDFDDGHRKLMRSDFVEFEAAHCHLSFRWLGLGARNRNRILMTVERMDGKRLSVPLEIPEMSEIFHELHLAAVAEALRDLPETVVSNYIQAKADLETAMRGIGGAS